MVRSRAKLSYEGVQADLDAGTADPVFGLLREVGERRLAREVARGGVSLPLPDQEVTCVDGRWELSHRQPLPVEQWNAQISLLTGMAAAHLMGEAGVGVLRTLAPADPRDVERLRRVAAGLGVTWPDGGELPGLHPPPRRVRGRGGGDARRQHRAAAGLRLRHLHRRPARAADARRARVDVLPRDGAAAPPRRPVRRRGVRRAVGRASRCRRGCCERFEELPDTMRESSRRANAYERAVLDLVEAALLRDRVGEEFAAMVVDVDDRKPERGDVVVRDPAVEAPVVGRAPLPLGTDVDGRG